MSESTLRRTCLLTLLLAGVWSTPSAAVVACTPLPTGLTITTTFPNPAAAKAALADGGTIAYQRKYVNASAVAIPVRVSSCFTIERNDGTTPFFCIAETAQSIGAHKTVTLNDSIDVPSGGKSLVISQTVSSDNASCGTVQTRLSYMLPSSGDAIQVAGYTPTTPVYPAGVLCGNLGTVGCQGTTFPGPPNCWQHSQRFTCELTAAELGQWVAQNCDLNARYRLTVPWTGRCMGPTQDGLIVTPPPAPQALMSVEGAEPATEWIILDPDMEGSE